MSRLGLHPNTVVVLAAAIASALLVALLVLRSSEAAFSAHASDEGRARLRRGQRVVLRLDHPEPQQLHRERHVPPGRRRDGAG